MTRDNTPDHYSTQKEDENERLTPSQAEGDRETVEQDLAAKSGRGGKPMAGGGEPQTTPSQAEGDRETIERDLNERGLD
jgi:hypothetical protein